ncbi:ECF transporter S component [Agromyces ramosus]|uniref:Energy-coupling factor transport system substrate-specific component n=1 Tax=Agromyces ramosus TaxID=33879 RepID=A0ABU0R4Z0_9MICO|nr:ECF transporter S component [Agromyces ramosus]MDQ0892792.1 energy-coupling factor transport system substrate-specific component [Agromyces ramosus]
MHRTSTRVILSCAAIGVGGGVVAAASGYFALFMAAVGPMFYGITIGSHFLPSVIALALLKRPGVAVLTGLIAGLVGAAFAPHWLPRFIGTGLLVGALLELPFLVTRYRRWDTWLYYVAAIAAGVVIAAGVFVVIGGEHFAWWAWAIALPLYAGSPVLFTWVGRVIAARLTRAGVARSVG